VERTTIFLIRHGLTHAVGRHLVSRTPGIHLSDEGRAQAERVRDRLLSRRLDAIYSSPIERALESAEPLAASRSLPITIHEGLIEVDFGEWTGMSFDDLSARSDWRRFNDTRSTAVVPGGERPTEVQSRVVLTLEDLRQRHRGQSIAAVSHADVIRSAVLHVAGTSLDHWYRFEISPGSITTITYEVNGVARLVGVNDVP
jgi:broad specificity phosphatase PhoE